MEKEIPKGSEFELMNLSKRVNNGRSTKEEDQRFSDLYCPEGAHYVKPHKLRNGTHVDGHCAKNPHRKERYSLDQMYR